ncbi:MAG: thioredoxin domain-containing protein [Gammaproteobacteria bacterium]|nr:thioredoxin domain-containing protein [Gammaproteobacteria bacterium]
MCEAPNRNRLTGETSPYLLQHAGNPVHWHPWSEVALALARRLDRPILLSIGYSACHWCHVMAHESFEDEATAALMNALFVNVKVDREERPDIDRIYQSAHYLLTRRNGGWPLTMFLTPDDQLPFFGGTYFPREARHGLPGFNDLLRWVAQIYRERGDDIRSQNAQLRRALDSVQSLPCAGADELDDTVLDAARVYATESYDPRWGGFGPAPKFPQAGAIERLLRRFCASVRRGAPDHEALAMALGTLGHMARGGIFDQLGGGFCRYSTDERWLIPHFEKMLYDNGPLLALYACAWQIRPEPLWRDTALGVADWVLREMQLPEGGLCSSLDADSEGEEGRFYVWTREQIGQLLTPDQERAATLHFGLDEAPNFDGRWHLHVRRPLAQVATAIGASADATAALVGEARRRLFEARERRPRPATDDKVLTSWNALMIKGLAIAGRVFARADYVQAGTRALDFLRTHLWVEGRLLATGRAGRAHLNAYLDDHAFLIDAILALLEAHWRDGDLEFAIALAEAMLARFEDRDQGGFFFTAHDHETLLQRPRTFTDDALPSGNGVAAFVLQRLGHLLGEPRYLDAAARTLRAAWPSIARMPAAHDALLAALEEYLEPTETIIVRGTGSELGAWREAARARYAPQRLVLAIPAGATALPGLLAQRPAGTGTVAYRCRGHQCDAPIGELEELVMQLRDTEIHGDHDTH